jgi:hypothetical protein
VACMPYGQDGPERVRTLFFLLHHVVLAVHARTAANVAGQKARCGCGSLRHNQVHHTLPVIVLPVTSFEPPRFVFQHAARRDAVMPSLLPPPQ